MINKQISNTKFRSMCPIARGLEIFGDKWTLLIIRDIALHDKTTFKELIHMPEGIATNTLASRLQRLVETGILTKTKSVYNKLVFHYNVTEMGRQLIPVLESIYNWSLEHLFTEEERQLADKLKK